MKEHLHQGWGMLKRFLERNRLCLGPSFGIHVDLTYGYLETDLRTSIF